MTDLVKPAARVFDRILHTPSGCWEWQGAILETGYGQIRVNGRSTKAHRAAYIATHGAIPAGLIVRHKCDNRRCVNPAHLELGTHRDNTADARARGRMAVGERCGRSKLFPEQVRCIRSRVASGETQASLASAFGVTPRAISAVVRRQSWRHI